MYPYMRYIWNFIAFPATSGIIEYKKPFLPPTSVEQIFYDVIIYILYDDVIKYQNVQIEVGMQF